MLILNKTIIGKPVQSLHTGEAIAFLAYPIVDYENLRVIAYKIIGSLAQQLKVDTILTEDIREISPIGVIVDSIDVLVSADEIIHVKKILDLRFDLLRLHVKTKKGKKLGSVVDFTFDPISFNIMQLIVARPALRAFIDSELVIARDKIIEVTDYDIIIKDETEKSKVKAKAKKKSVETKFTPNYINPFKNPEFAEEISAPADSQTPDS